MSEPITEADVRKVAQLGRLKLTDAQVAEYTRRLGAVLGYMDKLAELDLDGVEPMAHPTDLTNAFRDDSVGPTLSVDDALANAPDAVPPYFRVPKVIGESGA